MHKVDKRPVNLVAQGPAQAATFGHFANSLGHEAQPEADHISRTRANTPPTNPPMDRDLVIDTRALENLPPRTRRLANTNQSSLGDARDRRAAHDEVIQDADVESTDVPPLSVAQGFRVVRHCNGLDGQLFCVLGGRQPAQ